MTIKASHSTSSHFHRFSINEPYYTIFTLQENKQNLIHELGIKYAPRFKTLKNILSFKMCIQTIQLNSIVANNKIFLKNGNTFGSNENNSLYNCKFIFAFSNNEKQPYDNLAIMNIADLISATNIFEFKSYFKNNHSYDSQIYTFNIQHSVWYNMFSILANHYNIKSIVFENVADYEKNIEFRIDNLK